MVLSSNMTCGESREHKSEDVAPFVMMLASCRFLSRKCTKLRSFPASQDDFNFTFNPEKVRHTI